MEKTEDITAQERLNVVEGEINGLLTELANTDWCVVKCIETGENMQELYPLQYEARKNARARINELQLQLPALREALAAEIAALDSQNIDSENGDSQTAAAHNA